MPQISVIIPTYNRADVLPRAIDSVLAQTETDLELLVVDDGSTDDTQELLDSIDDPRLRTEVHGTNRGANVARNTGIDRARGEYVAFLDSDDVWRPTKLENQLDMLDRRSKEWVGVYCGFEIRQNGLSGRFKTGVARLLSHVDAARSKEGGSSLAGEILADNVHPGAGSTLLVRTDVAREIGGFNETLDRFQDPEFVIRILGEGKLAYVDEPLVIRYDTGAPNADAIRAANQQYLSIYSDTIDRLEAEGFDIRGSHNFLLAKMYYQEGEYLTGTRYLCQSSVRFRHFPGLFWAVGSGIRYRRKVGIAVIAVLLFLVLVWSAMVS